MVAVRHTSSARLGGLEPPTSRFVGGRSVPLSYKRSSAQIRANLFPRRDSNSQLPAPNAGASASWATRECGLAAESSWRLTVEPRPRTKKGHSQADCRGMTPCEGSRTSRTQGPLRTRVQGESTRHVVRRAFGRAAASSDHCRCCRIRAVIAGAFRFVGGEAVPPTPRLERSYFVLER